MGTVAQEFDECVADKAERNTVGNRVGKRHEDDGQECRCSFGHVVPIDFARAAQHLRSNIEQGGSGSECRNALNQRRENQTGQHQDADGNGSQAGAAAGRNACRAFNIRGGRRRTQGGISDDGG